MNTGRYFALACILVSASTSALAGCESSGEGSTAGMGGSAGGETGATTGGGAEAETAELRVAHLSPDVGAVDFCLQRSGESAFQGPFMGTEDIAYGQVTKYVTIREGTYTVRFMAAGQENCDLAFAGTADVSNIKVEANKRYTVAAMGDMAPPDENTQGFTVKLFADRTAIPEDKVSLTFIHASPDAPKVDFGTGAGNDFNVIFGDVAFGEKGESGGTAYYETDAIDATAITMRQSGTAEEMLTVEGFALPADTISTVYAIGMVSGVPKQLGVLVCYDNRKPEGSFAVCEIKP